MIDWFAQDDDDDDEDDVDVDVDDDVEDDVNVDVDDDVDDYDEVSQVNQQADCQTSSTASQLPWLIIISNSSSLSRWLKLSWWWW